MKTKDGTIRVGVRKDGDDYLPWFDTVEEAIEVFTNLVHKDKELEYSPYYVGDIRYENIYGMDYEIECGSCRKVRFITNRSNRKWTQCKACQYKLGVKALLHYREDPDEIIDMSTHPIPMDSNGKSYIAISIVGRIETEKEAIWIRNLSNILPLGV